MMPAPVNVRDPRKSDKTARHGWIWRFFHTVRWSLRLTALAALAVLAGVLYVTLVGFPAAFTDRCVAGLKAGGYRVEVAKLTFDVWGGIAAHQVRWYESEGARQPFLEAKEVSFSVPLTAFFREGPLPWKLRIRNGSVRYSTEGDPTTADNLRDLVLQQVDATLVMDPEGLDVTDFHGRLLGIQWDGAGTVVSPPASTNRLRANPADIFRQLKRRGPDWLPPLVEQLNRIRFATTPRSVVRFTLYPTNPALSEITLDMQGGKTRARGVLFEDWRLNVSLQNRRVWVRDCRIRRRKGKLELSGVWNLRTQRASAHLLNTLPPAPLLRLIPSDWRAYLAENSDLQEASLFCEVWAGPAPVTHLARRVRGRFSLDRARLLDVWVEHGYAAFNRHANRLSITRLDAILGEGVQQGPLRATCEYDLETDSYSGGGSMRFDPNVLQPIFNDLQKEIAGWFDFYREPPEAEFTFDGRVGAVDAFRVSGHARARSFRFHDVEADYFESDVSIVTNVMTFQNAYLRRPEGEGGGTVVQDFNTQFVYMNVTSSIHPQAIAQAIGPEADAFMRQFRMEGPIRVEAQGMVDYGHWTRTDIEARVRGEKIGMFWCLADEAAFDFRMTGRRIEMNSITGRVYNGPFSAQASFFPVGSDTNMRYEVTADIRDAEFAQLLLAMQQETNTVQQGWFSGDVRMEGFIGRGRGDTATGAGRVSVVDGRLFELRLLGQLSHWLSRIYPGFGGFRQTDFTGSFIIADRKVVSTDAFLEGDILSIKAEGEYNFNHSLDYRVQVQPLRAGWIARTLRMVTFPVTKLLEFRLIGTLEDPRWRPVNFPKELFFIFD